MTSDTKAEIADRLCKHFERSDTDEKLDVGFGTIVAKHEIPNTESNSNQDNCLVMFTMEEIEHLKAIAGLARIGLEQRDRDERERFSLILQYILKIIF